MTAPLVLALLTRGSTDQRRRGEAATRPLANPATFIMDRSPMPAPSRRTRRIRRKTLQPMALRAKRFGVTTRTRMAYNIALRAFPNGAIRADAMLDKLAEVEGRYREIETLMGDPAIATDYAAVAELAKERASLQAVVDAYREYRKQTRELDEASTAAAKRRRRRPARAGARGNHGAGEQQRHTGRRIAADGCCQKTRATPRMSSWKSARALAETRLASSPATCCACIPAMPKAAAGKSSCWMSTSRATASSRTSPFRSAATAPSAG